MGRVKEKQREREKEKKKLHESYTKRKVEDTTVKMQIKIARGWKCE